MKTVNIPGFLVHCQYPWQDEGTLSFYPTSSSTFKDDVNTVAIRPYTLTVQIPKNFDPLPQKIAALQGTIQQIRTTSQAECGKIEEEIAKLSGLTYKAPTTKNGNSK